MCLSVGRHEVDPFLDAAEGAAYDLLAVAGVACP